jgi:hypothetical protein
MKYISLVIVLVMMAWTWCLANSPREFSLENHKRVEAGVEEDVQNFIRKRHPTTSEINCNQLYSEDVDSDAANSSPSSVATDLIVHFRCEAQETVAADNTSAQERVDQVFEGFLRLHSDDGFATWSETGGEINSPAVTFERGAEVTAKEPATPPESSSATQQPSAAQPAAQQPTAPAHTKDTAPKAQ